MNPKYKKPPVLQDLIDEQNKHDYQDSNTPEQLQNVIDLFTAFPEYFFYLEKRQIADYDIPYSVYWCLHVFVQHLYNKQEINTIKKIFTFLDERLTKSLKTNNHYSVGLIRIGSLECFDNILDILHHILPLMPDGLRKDFEECFPESMFHVTYRHILRK